MRQENARIIAEQVERRLAQELEWRDASRLQPQEQQKPKEEQPEPEPEPEAKEASAEEKEKAGSFMETFLSKCGLLDIYGAKFSEMGYDSELAIKLMDSADLDTMGITALGHRRIILNAVATLNKQQ